MAAISTSTSTSTSQVEKSAPEDHYGSMAAISTSTSTSTSQVEKSTTVKEDHYGSMAAIFPPKENTNNSRSQTIYDSKLTSSLMSSMRPASQVENQVENQEIQLESRFGSRFQDDRTNIIVSLPLLKTTTVIPTSLTILAEYFRLDILSKFCGELATIDTTSFHLGIVDPKQGDDYVLWLDESKTLIENDVNAETIVALVDEKEFLAPGEEEKPIPPQILEGYLAKVPAGHLKQTKRRWFTTLENQLMYFKNPKDLDPIGVIPLGIATEITHRDKSIFITIPKRTYNLMANSAEDAEQWSEGLEKIATFYKQNKDLIINCIKEGDLLKQGGPRKAWKLRLFKLSKDHLVYYEGEREGSQHRKGKIPLFELQVTELEKERGPKGFVFQVVSTRKTYILAADTQEERSSWIDALKTSIQEVNVSISNITVL
eukprot:TRINITY_DN1353_c3_g1_i1.p1 TRINITY_DN1353_c3_g1~~TRINITY_DN1353_c3_g1_i1.p1  ORF type:complete len:445 (+),score=201.83 TRINITY_DN1353_c3_g1_i1:49-1335(+)